MVQLRAARSTVSAPGGQLRAHRPQLIQSSIVISTWPRIRSGYWAGAKTRSTAAREGDAYARCQVRIEEIYQSFRLIRQAVDKIPEGPLAVPVKGSPDGEYFMRIEQPRGEAVYYVKGSGSRFIDRFRLRTPTTSNFPPMLDMLKGCQLADVPLLILTIDPCISCTER